MEPTPTTTLGLIIFGLYLLVVIAIGVFSVRYQKSSADFWVGGRRFGVAVLVMANMAAIMHGGSILSGIAFTGRFGGVAVLPNLSFALGFAIIFFFFARKLRESRGFTLPDYMGDRFASPVLRGWSAVMVAVSSLIYLVAQIRGMGFILDELLGIPFHWAMALGTVIFVVYVALGGLIAVVWTNIAQFIFMWVGLLLLAPFVYQRLGGWFSVVEKVEAVAPGWTAPQGLEWSWSYLLSWYVIWLVAYCTRLELLTKMFAARDHRVARCSLPWTITLVMVFLLYGNFYLGAAARILVWNDVASPDQAFPTLIATVLPPFLAALALTGVASAAMSTSDSLLLMSGSAVAHDLVRRCFHERRGRVRDELFYLRTSRLTIVGIGVLAFLGSLPDLALILRIVSYAVAIVGAAFFFPLLVGLTWRRVSKEAALASSVGGVVVTGLWTWGTLTGAPWAQNLHPGIPGLVTAGLLIIVVTGFTPPVEKEALEKFFSRPPSRVR